MVGQFIERFIYVCVRKFNMAKKKLVNKKLFCKDCGSKNIYSLKDKTKVCRKCGWREKKKGGN